MRRFKCLFLLVGLCFSSFSMLLAQEDELSRAEKKKLQDELSQLQNNVYAYRQMKEENEKLEALIRQNELLLDEQSRQLHEFNQTLYQRDSVLADLRQEFNRLINPIPPLTSNLDPIALPDSVQELVAANPYVEGKNLPFAMRVSNREAFFRVQVGAYRNQKIAKFLQENVNFITEEGTNGIKKYLIGDFASYEEAKRLARFLLNNGAQAFVVGYLNDDRLSSLRKMPKEYF